MIKPSPHRPTSTRVNFVSAGAKSLAVLSILIISGCGYTRQGESSGGSYQWQSLYREDIQTVAVPIFANKDFERGVEFSLTKAVINQLEATTPYKVVPKERADTILEATVTLVKTKTLSESSSTALPQEQMTTLAINFTWKDLRSGRILVQRKAFEQTATYYPTLGEGRFVGNQQAVEKLAVAIVQELQADW